MPILGWWQTGETEDGWKTLVALVAANSEQEAKETVNADWPEAYDWRFCDEVDLIFRPSNRFVRERWMLKRTGETEQDVASFGGMVR